MQASHLDNSLENARTTSTDIGETFLLWGTRLGRNKMCLPPDPFGVARESAIGHARLPTEVPQIKHVSVASYRDVRHCCTLTRLPLGGHP